LDTHDYINSLNIYQNRLSNLHVNYDMFSHSYEADIISTTFKHSSQAIRSTQGLKPQYLLLINNYSNRQN